MSSETITRLRASLASQEEHQKQLESEWDELLRDTITLHDQTRGAHGTMSLMLTYIRETAVVMQHLGFAQDNGVLKSMFNDLTSRLKRQAEACERIDAALASVLESLERWKGKVRR